MFQFFCELRYNLRKYFFRIVTAFFIPCFTLVCLSNTLFFILTAHAEIVSDTLIGSYSRTSGDDRLEDSISSGSYDSSLQLCLCDIDLSTTQGSLDLVLQ